MNIEMNRELAKKYLPEIHLCNNEPFYPIKIGYEIFMETSMSNSFARNKHIIIDSHKIAFAIEYQIYWHYDITHMFDLEHIWIYIDHFSNIADAECSSHGKCINALLSDKSNIIDKTHLKLYSQPGKHAFAPNVEFFNMMPEFKYVTTNNVGEDGLITRYYEDGKYKISNYLHDAIRRYMQKYKFKPSEYYSKFDLDNLEILEWNTLRNDFTNLIDSELEIIMKNTKHIIVFLDSGDTLVDEGTEIYDEDGIVLEANLIDGAKEMVTTLFNKGYTLVLVADGNAQSFKNVLSQNGLYDYFSSMIYSECVKVQKPNHRMFKAALGSMELTSSDLDRIIMVGNNLKKDIKGANEMNITSVFIKWSPRYSLHPTCSIEVPDYTILKPLELIPIVENLNAEYEEYLLSANCSN